MQCIHTTKIQQRTSGVAQKFLCSCRRKLRDPMILKPQLANSLRYDPNPKMRIPGLLMLERSRPFRLPRQTLTNIRATLSNNPIPDQQGLHLGAHKSLSYSGVIIVYLVFQFLNERTDIREISHVLINVHANPRVEMNLKLRYWSKFSFGSSSRDEVFVLTFSSCARPNTAIS